MNRVELTGRLVKDIEIRSTSSDKKVAKGTIAVNRRFKNKDENYDADFLDFEYWNISDKFGDYLKKGKQIGLVGRIAKESYEKDGNKYYVINIVAEDIELLGDKSATQTETQTETQEVEIPQNTTSNYEGGIELDDNSLPF